MLTTVGTLLFRNAFGGRPGGLSQAIWFHSGQLPFVRSTANAMLSITIVALGASLGREAAPKEFGAALASKFAEFFTIDAAERRLLVACGAGAGMAAVYNVPLGGALFAVEVLLGTLSLSLVLPALVASLIATAVAWITLAPVATYQIPGFTISASMLTWTIPFALFAGIASALYVRVIAWASRNTPKGKRVYVVPVAVFTGLGILACWYP